MPSSAGSSPKRSFISGVGGDCSGRAGVSAAEQMRRQVECTGLHHLFGVCVSVSLWVWEVWDEGRAVSVYGNQARGQPPVSPAAPSQTTSPPSGGPNTC